MGRERRSREIHRRERGRVALTLPLAVQYFLSLRSPFFILLFLRDKKTKKLNDERSERQGKEMSRTHSSPCLLFPFPPFLRNDGKRQK